MIERLWMERLEIDKNGPRATNVAKGETRTRNRKELGTRLARLLTVWETLQEYVGKSRITFQSFGVSVSEQRRPVHKRGAVSGLFFRGNCATRARR
jgi:hypothetical protein